MDKQLQDLFDTLKKLGLHVEFKINKDIQESLNKKEIAKLLHKHSHALKKIIEGLKELVDTISIPLNFPTKTDVANVAKQAQQNEDKLESIEGQLKLLNEYLREIIGETPQTNHTPPTKEDEDDEIDLKRLKKLLILHKLWNFVTHNGPKKDRFHGS